MLSVGAPNNLILVGPANSDVFQFVASLGRKCVVKMPPTTRRQGWCSSPTRDNMKCTHQFSSTKDTFPYITFVNKLLRVMIKMGEYNVLKVIKEKSMGLFMDDGAEGILLPKRFVPPGTQIGDELKVFLYHDGEDRPIATTQKPYGIVGDIVKLKAISSTNQGAFLDWGLMKDLFVPKSKIKNYMVPNGEYLVKIFLDEKTGRIAATEKLEAWLSNEDLTVKELEEVDLLVYRKTDIGYEVIINNIHKGMLHNNEIYRDIAIGGKFRGFIKNILPENKMDVAAGKPGFERVEDATEKVERLLKENDGYLPYHDKSSSENIYSFFAMSKKTFKMATGNLYKQKKIVFTKTGIQLIE